MSESTKQPQHFEYVSYEEGREQEKKRLGVLDKIRKAAYEAAAELKQEKTADGKPKYEFEFLETPDLFIIKKGPSEIRMAKVYAAKPGEIRKSVEELHSKQGGSSADSSE